MLNCDSLMSFNSKPSQNQMVPSNMWPPRVKPTVLSNVFQIHFLGESLVCLTVPWQSLVAFLQDLSTNRKNEVQKLKIRGQISLSFSYFKYRLWGRASRLASPCQHPHQPMTASLKTHALLTSLFITFWVKIFISLKARAINSSRLRI